MRCFFAILKIMQTDQPQLAFAIHRTVKDIPKEDWDRLFGNDTIEGYGYQKAIEESNSGEFSFGYLTGSRAGINTAVIPFFVMDFSLDMLAHGPLRKLMRAFKGMFSFKVLFFGTPTAEEFYLGISPGEDPCLLLEKSLNAISLFCRKERVGAVAFNNISAKNSVVAQYLKKKKFIRLESLPTTVLKINASSLEEYVDSLSTNMRKNLKRKLKNSNRQTSLTTVIRDSVEDVAPEIYRLYMNNFEDSGVHFETLTREFFTGICREMPGIARYFLTYDKERIVAFNLCLIKGDTLIDKFIGFDPELARKYHLYFTTFCNNVDFCIKNNIRFYYPGTTDYHPKLRLGAELIPLDIWTRSSNPLLNLLVKSLRPLIQPKNLDPSLKDIGKLKRKNAEG